MSVLVSVYVLHVMLLCVWCVCVCGGGMCVCACDKHSQTISSFDPLKNPRKLPLSENDAKITSSSCTP